jgi:hypothetical protein
MDRLEIINSLIAKHNYKSYVEIGVRKGDTFKRVKAEDKIGVDIEPGRWVTHCMSSDEFFDRNKRQYDIFLIDGLHEEEQVYRDINNALYCLRDGGTIVCHDMNPLTKEMQVVPRQQAEWTGDGWKAWVRMRIERADLFMEVVNTDYGCGIIQEGCQDTIKVEEPLTYEGLVANRREWLNLVGVDTFNETFR